MSMTIERYRPQSKLIKSLNEVAGYTDQTSSYRHCKWFYYLALISSQETGIAMTTITYVCHRHGRKKYSGRGDYHESLWMRGHIKDVIMTLEEWDNLECNKLARQESQWKDSVRKNAGCASWCGSSCNGESGLDYCEGTNCPRDFKG